MERIVWDLPSEGAIIDRIAELEACLQNFPESKMAWVWRNAIAELQAKLEPLTRG